ncbi:hypothetical protein M3Y99_01034600 [Aphelenchoides fujianensis]|nr:hypothetical protein M3Y99_01034600 [Aphelenchoides fujianensis]
MDSAVENRVTRSSARTKRPLAAVAQPPPAKPKAAQPSAPKPNGRSKPAERNGGARVTRSTAKPEPKRRAAAGPTADDEGPRKLRNISVGEKFQTTLPACTPTADRSAIADRDVCQWSFDAPKPQVDDVTIREFCQKTHERLNLNTEKALHLLYRSDFDVKAAMTAAVEAAGNQRAEWSESDAYTFYALFQIYGRDFAKIQTIMAHKSVRAIIDHYYQVKLRMNLTNLLDNEIGFEFQPSRKTSTEEKAPDVAKPSVCSNCGSLTDGLYHIANQLQCLSCKLHFEAFNSHRNVDRREPQVYLKHRADAVRFVRQFKEKCEPQKATGKSKCEENKQNALHDCRVLRGIVMRKETNAAKIAQRLAAEVQLSDYRALLTANNASSSRLRVSNLWTTNEKRLALQALIRYRGNRDMATAVVGTKSAEAIADFYERYKDVIEEAIREEPDESPEELERQANAQLSVHLDELARDVVVVNLE